MTIAETGHVAAPAAILHPGRDEACLDPKIVGGKAAALTALLREGLPVPPFFVALAPEGFEQGLSLADCRAIDEALAEVQPGPFAVRSSARDEDGAEHSHAGQFLSLLDIEDSGVPDAALKVWESGAQENVAAYRASRGLEAGDATPAVIVQRMARARVAGVAFAADPVSGRRDRIVISAIAGLGDALVGGEEDGETTVVDRDTGRIVEGPAGGVLSDADVAAVVEAVKRVSGLRGTPQDIEWAIEGETFFLLQSRPITTALREPAIGDPSVTIFDNSNIVESYPGLVSPLTYSFAQYAYARVYRRFMELLGVSDQNIRESAAVFDNMLGRIDGRVYYNLVNWYRALALLPGFSLNRAHMETMMGVSEPLPAEISAGIGPAPATGLAKLREYVGMARAGAGLLFEAARLRWTVRGFYARMERALATRPEAISKMPLGALAAEYRKIEGDLLDRWDAPLVNDFLCMMAFGSSRKLLERWCGEQGLELHNAIMIGQGDIVSAEPARRIARMGEIARGNDAAIAALERGDLGAMPPALVSEIRGYIEKFGDRCTEELKLESVTLDEDPAPLYAAIAAAARTTRTHKQEVDGDAALAAAFEGRRFRGLVAKTVVGWARARVRDRENLRFERTRIFGRARRVLLAMGRQFAAIDAIDEPRDVFLLTLPEILGAIEGFGVTADLKGLVAVRKAEMERAARLPDPPERVTVSGAAGLSAPRPATAAAAGASDDIVRSGTGCSAGVVKAKARLIRDPRIEALAPGEILVARNTDPGWIAVFSNASAIVVERGSLLSHSAIVAREMGIPCVVALKGALEWIRDGETIEVDGARGVVTRSDV